MATVDAGDVWVVPGGVALEDAAMVQLGIIAAQAVRKAAMRPGEPYAVMGAGIVGALAQRLARAQGAGHGTVIARTSQRVGVAERGGADRFVAVSERPDRLEEVAWCCWDHRVAPSRFDWRRLHRDPVPRTARRHDIGRADLSAWGRLARQDLRTMEDWPDPDAAWWRTGSS